MTFPKMCLTKSSERGTMLTIPHNKTLTSSTTVQSLGGDSGILHSCVNLPLRLSARRNYFLPQEWGYLATILADLVAVEHSRNAHWRDTNAYLTVIPVTAVKDVLGASQTITGLLLGGNRVTQLTDAIPHTLRNVDNKSTLVVLSFSPNRLPHSEHTVNGMLDY